MIAASNALLLRYPQLSHAIPWVSLGVGVTPLAVLELEGREILVKRDDLTATPYGGNKVRKLEFILARARAAGATRLLTAGATGSHHVLATTLYGRRLGFDVTAVLFPQHRTPHVRDVLLRIAEAGAELRFVSRMQAIPWGMWRERRAAGERAFTVAPGGSDPIGTLGYVAAALELDEQLARSPVPDAIYISAGTLGTVAGVALGLALAHREIPVVAVRITSRLITNRRVLQRLIEGSAAILGGAGVEVGDAAARALASVQIVDDQLGAGYGHATAAGDDAARLFASRQIALDPTYTAKVAAAVLSSDTRQPLFWHTLSAVMPPLGSTPALPPVFADYLARPTATEPS